MSKSNNLGDFLSDIASSIKSKKGYASTKTINAQNFATEIDGIGSKVYKATNVYGPILAAGSSGTTVQTSYAKNLSNCSATVGGMTLYKVGSFSISTLTGLYSNGIKVADNIPVYIGNIQSTYRTSTTGAQYVVGSSFYFAKSGTTIILYSGSNTIYLPSNSSYYIIPQVAYGSVGIGTSSTDDISSLGSFTVNTGITNSATYSLYYVYRSTIATLRNPSDSLYARVTIQNNDCPTKLSTLRCITLYATSSTIVVNSFIDAMVEEE